MGIWQYASKYILCESSRSIFMQLKLNHETKFIVYGEEDVSVCTIYGYFDYGNTYNYWCR